MTSLMSNQPEICTICTEPCDDNNPGHKLGCGHTFHVECVLHWFRFENTSCPNCRSEKECHFWMPMSASQRVGLLRRRRHKLPRDLQRRIQKLDEYRALQKELRKERKDLKKANSQVFSTYNKLGSRIRCVEQKEESLFMMLSNQASEHVPFLEPLDYDEYSDSDDSELVS